MRKVSFTLPFILKEEFEAAETLSVLNMAAMEQLQMNCPKLR